ncbi:MAG: hypothetical protein U9Q81_07305 [Pseudomonadota bacterium]|nr:hypothetical protein [Pseudomonadota bacterium]
MREPSALHFSRNHAVSAVDIVTPDELPAALRVLGLSPPQPVLVLVGGADGLGPERAQRLRSLFRDVIAPLLDRLGAAVIDGGTDSGVMALMGQARTEVGAGFPLIGVAARGTVKLPADPPEPDQQRTALEPNHTHFLLVPGDRWGDESPWISDTASALGDRAAAASLVAGGGKVTLLDVEHSLSAGRRTLLLVGSGRTADRLADALRLGKLPALGILEERAELLQPIVLAEAERALPALLQSLYFG